MTNRRSPKPSGHGATEPSTKRPVSDEKFREVVCAVASERPKVWSNPVNIRPRLFDNLRRRKNSEMTVTARRDINTRRTRSQSADGARKYGLWGDHPLLQESPKPDAKYDDFSGVFNLSKHPRTIFRRFYERGDLPIVIKHRARLGLEFKAPIESLDVSYYLPIFIDGLRERKQPFRFVAQEGTMQLIHFGDRSQIIACLPELVYPIKFALQSCDKPTIILALRVLQSLSSSGKDVAECLVPFYRQLLPALNRYKNHKRNLGDQMDFSQNKHDGRTLGETIEETLTLLEQTGGEDAFINIKYIVPTYETAL